MEDDLRSEYDLKNLRVRKLGYRRKNYRGTIVHLEPDVAEIFPNPDAVNEALRFLIRVTQENQLNFVLTKENTALEEMEAHWYIAELVMECRVEREPLNVIHVNIVLVRANSPEEAFEKAEQLGRNGEDTYLNPNNQIVTFTYRGLRDLNIIHDELEHGGELMFEEKIGVSEHELQEMLTPKYELAVFRLSEMKDSSKPSYSCKEIMDEVIRRLDSGGA